MKFSRFASVENGARSQPSTKVQDDGEAVLLYQNRQGKAAQLGTLLSLLGNT